MVQTDLAEKKEKKKNLLLSKTGHIWRRFSSRKHFNVFTGVGCVNQNHNKDTMKSEKITSCIVIKTTLERFREVLLEQGGALKELLKVANPDAKAILAAIRSIEFLLEDQSEDIRDKWVTSRVKTDEGTKFISNRAVREVRVYQFSFSSAVLNIWSPNQFCCFA